MIPFQLTESRSFECIWFEWLWPIKRFFYLTRTQSNKQNIEREKKNIDKNQHFQNDVDKNFSFFVMLERERKMSSKTNNA